MNILPAYMYVYTMCQKKESDPLQLESSMVECYPEKFLFRMYMDT